MPRGRSSLCMELQMHVCTIISIRRSSHLLHPSFNQSERENEVWTNSSSLVGCTDEVEVTPGLVIGPSPTSHQKLNASYPRSTFASSIQQQWPRQSG